MYKRQVVSIGIGESIAVTERFDVSRRIVIICYALTVGVINGGNKALGVVVVIILRQHRVPGGHACYAVVGVGRDGIACLLYTSYYDSLLKYGSICNSMAFLCRPPALPVTFFEKQALKTENR